MTAGRAEVLSAGDISDQCTRGDQIRRNTVLRTSVDGFAEFVLDALRNVEPVEVSLYSKHRVPSNALPLLTALLLTQWSPLAIWADSD